MLREPRISRASRHLSLPVRDKHQTHYEHDFIEDAYVIIEPSLSVGPDLEPLPSSYQLYPPRENRAGGERFYRLDRRKDRLSTRTKRRNHRHPGESVVEDRLAPLQPTRNLARRRRSTKIHSYATVYLEVPGAIQDRYTQLILRNLRGID